MKRHRFCSSLLALLAGTFLLASCAPPPPPATPQAPAGIHAAPNRQPISLTPTRDGEVIVAPGMAEADSTNPADALPTRTVRVGLLLPLTGRSAALGKNLQDAATIALFDKYARLSTAQQKVRVELLPKDTGDTPEQAREAMQAALDDGAELIIGPLFGNATEAVAPMALAEGISVISFSNNAALARPGVYIYGFRPEEQAARVVGYALRQGKTRIAALVPEGATGDIVLKGARETMAKAGLALTAEVKYTPQGTGMDVALEKLVPEGTAVNFDALLLPEGGPVLATLLRTLQTRGVTSENVQLLGTGFWDEPTLLRRVNLQGAWLASSPPQSTAQFEQRFMATYNYTPQRISSLAYDAVALAVTLATSGRPFDAPNLSQSAGFTGPANGVFRLRGNGNTERALAVLQVDGANLVTIDAPPAGFTSVAAQQ